MKAVRIYNHGDVDALKYEEINEPLCTVGKVKIKIHAAALNHLDIWVRKGMPEITLRLPMILGSDGAGTIIETGKNVTSWKKGDDVVIQPGTFCCNCSHCKNGNENYCHQYGILGETENGVQAEFIVVDPINIYAKPVHLTFEEASSMQLVFMTAYQMLINRAHIKKNESILIYGGTSGIGSAAIQICRHLGAMIIATVGNSSKVEYAKKMGADYVLIHSNTKWQDEVISITGKTGVDVIFEHIGKATWNQSMRMLANGGRIITCGATTGADVNINLLHLFIKQHSIFGSTMSSLQTFKDVMEKIHNKVYFPFVDKIFSMENIRQAHKYIENRQHMGKVIVKIDL